MRKTLDAEMSAIVTVSTLHCEAEVKACLWVDNQEDDDDDEEEEEWYEKQFGDVKQHYELWCETG